MISFWGQKKFVKIENVYLVLVFKRKSIVLGLIKVKLFTNTKQEAMTNIWLCLLELIRISGYNQVKTDFA